MASKDHNMKQYGKTDTPETVGFFTSSRSWSLVAIQNVHEHVQVPARFPFLLYNLLRVPVRFRASISYAERVAFLVWDLVIFLVQELIQDQAIFESENA